MAQVILAVVLTVKVLALPFYPAFVAGYYETEAQCRAAAEKIDASTPVLLRLTCEVQT